MDWTTGKVITPTATYTSIEIEELALGMAAIISDSSVTAGDRVVISADNSAEYIAALLALMHLDCSIVLVDHRETLAERRRMSATAKARLLITDNDFADLTDRVPSLAVHSLAEEARRRKPGTEFLSFSAWHARSDALVTWSSGSTGSAKGVVRSGRAFLNDLQRTRERMGYRPDDVLMPLLPFSHFYGLTLAILQWTVGCSLVVAPLERLDLAVRLAAVAGATVIDATPSTYHTLHAMARRRPGTVRELSSVRMFCTGGAPLPPALNERFGRTFSRPLLDGYGSNEAGNIALASPANPGGCGRPLTDVDVRILDRDGSPTGPGQVGEIFVESPSLMAGYLAQDGTVTPVGAEPFATEDLGYWTPEGNLVVMGRKHAVQRMGHNLYLEAIERKAEFCGRPVKIVAVDDERQGSQLVFFVEDQNEASASHWRTAICSLLPSYEHPNKVVVLPSLPVNGTGKVDVRNLRRLAENAVYRPVRLWPRPAEEEDIALPAGLDRVPFAERVAALKAVAHFLRTDPGAVLAVLTEISDYKSVEAEIDGALHTLAGAVEEVVRNEPPKVDRMAVFMSSNVLLTAYVLYLLVPALYTESVVARPSTQVAAQTRRLHELLAPVHGLPIEMSSLSQRKFREGPVAEADVVVFTGTYQNAETIRADLRPEQIFMLFGQGANPFIVAPGADIDVASEDALRIRMLNSGQDCFGPDVFFIHESDAPRFVEALLKRLSTLTFGDYDDPEADYGPMCYPSAIVEAAEFLQDNTDHIIYGGQIDFRTRQIQPTVLLRSARDEMALSEIFAPLFNLVTYSDLSQVYEKLGTGYYQDRAMGAMVYGDAPELVEHLRKRHMVGVGETLLDIDNGNLPFGGRGIMANYVAHRKKRTARPLLISQIVAEYAGDRAGRP
ncbi:aldehyde dehydrogenase family protein [Nonomuraea sp. NPDC000554]|uniref:aldehyde dehydrogenase family protein n=1 Tax=Nonomuraea sp. NPDC000554 TaxID=3154259 RepID=UPI00331C977B